MLQPITPTPQAWDDFVATQPRAHVLQQSAWSVLKGAYGWGSERIALAEGDQIIAGAQVLFRRMPMGLGSMAYLAMGPYGAREHRKQLWQEIDKCSKSRRAAFLKWEPGIYLDEPAPDFANIGLNQSLQTGQPPRTILIDIAGTEDEILARMNQGTRRKIRQSLKNGIRYYQATADDVTRFTDMMQTTGARNEFGVHEPAYYALAYKLFVPSGTAALILAEHEGDTLAGVMVFAAGKTAWYFYGASSNAKRNLMATYGVQWQAILWAKARGCTLYDMWGVPDEEEEYLEAHFEERSDGLWGVYGFKRGWGGKVVRSAGAWDRVYNPIVYAAYRWAMRSRRG